jgi:DNA topoisomerase-1
VEAWTAEITDAATNLAPRVESPVVMQSPIAKTGTRPIPIDRSALQMFVQRDLMPQIERWLRRHPRQEDPIGRAENIARDSLPIEDSDGRSRRYVPISVESEASSAKGASVLGGRYRSYSDGSGEIILYMNGALSPKDYLVPDGWTNRMQPVTTCRHETCLAYGLYSILSHEVTHAADRSRAKTKYNPSKADDPHNPEWLKYINDPGEIRAFMQQIVDEVESNAATLTAESVRGLMKSNHDLVETALLLSTTWEIIEPHLTRQHRNRILKAVYDMLDRKGLLPEGTDSSMAHRVFARFLRVLEVDGVPEGLSAVRVAARYKSKKKVKTQDGDERVVSEYSERQIANRNRNKAETFEKLTKSIDKLRAKVRRDMKSSDPEKKLTALAVALMDETAERVGDDDESAEERGHFGVTGWQRKHVSFGRDGVTITYVGKSGVKHKKRVTDATFRKVLRDAYEAVDADDTEILSWEGGRVTAEKVNAYLKPFGVTAKDIQGFHANTLMREKLKDVRKGQLPENKKERKKLLKDEFKEALEQTAEEVGHEPATLRSQYLVPGLEDTYLKDGSVIDKLG